MYTEGRETEMAKYQRIISKHIQYIDQQGHLHRVIRLVRRTEHRRYRETNRLEEAEQISRSVRHQIRTDIHQDQHLPTEQEKHQADQATYAGVKQQGGS